MRSGLTSATRAKKDLPKENKRGTFWRGTALETNTQLLVGHAIANIKEQVAQDLMKQSKERWPQQALPAIATDGKGAYREALVETWGKMPARKLSGQGLPPEKKQPQPGWHYLQVVKHRESGHVVKVAYGNQATLDMVGAHTSYVERTEMSSMHIQGRLGCETLSFSKELEMLKASSVWEDEVYNLTRKVKSLRVGVEEVKRRFELRKPAITAELTDHIRSIKELLWTVVSPIQSRRVYHPCWPTSTNARGVVVWCAGALTAATAPRSKKSSSTGACI